MFKLILIVLIITLLFILNNSKIEKFRATTTADSTSTISNITELKLIIDSSTSPAKFYLVGKFGSDDYFYDDDTEAFKTVISDKKQKIKLLKKLKKNSIFY